MTTRHLKAGNRSPEWYAGDTRRRYRVGNPADLDRVLGKLRLKVQRYPFAGRAQEEIVLDVIGIQSTIEDSRQVRELIAHAIGHYLMHEGNQRYLLEKGDRVVAWKWEHQAWAYAYELLMPARRVNTLLRRGWSDSDIQEHFAVSAEFYQGRMEAFREAFGLRAMTMRLA
ncbi:MAG: ImmA/IrrE family metallo-endopeptidase [Chloroflexi bacterium]|nr:ImmA/IrrE family metallo-endopeptidase [Chloroflexota bacterium]